MATQIDNAAQTYDDVEEEKTKERQPCPEAKANIISKIFLGWVFSLVYRGFKNPLQDEDLWELRDFERGQHTFSSLSNQWNNVAKSNSKNRLGRSILRIHRSNLIIGSSFKIIDIALQALQPIFIFQLISFLGKRDEPVGKGIGWALALFAAPLLKSIFENQYFLLSMRTGMRVRSSLQGMIYDKSLRMSPSARASSSLGQIVNLMQLDTQRIGDFFQFIHLLWASPAQIIISVILLFRFLSVSAVIGLVLTLATLPIQGKLLQVQLKLRKAGIGITDRRVKLMNEILQGIKAVKLYAWEDPFSQAVQKERSEEVKKIAGTVWIRSAFMAIMIAIPIIISVVTFTFYTAVFGNDLDPAAISASIAILNQLRTPVMMLPMTINALIDSRLGLKRIERFLDMENAENYSRQDANIEKKASAVTVPDETDSYMESSSDTLVSASILMKDSDFEWSNEGNKLEEEVKKKSLISKCFGRGKKSKDSPNTPSEANQEANDENSTVKGPTLQNISLHFSPTELVGIVGRVGSGKSSLIHAILGEMRKIRGNVRLRGTVAYVAQTAWIFNDTLRNNITFGKKFNAALYKKALEVSALNHDIGVLPGGDMTAIGEKGINLSGGQKQRVSIARAVYADADVYLFDDPLSALDAHVSREVFEKCISKEGVLKDRLRVLITNQTHVLPHCDKIVLLENGQIRCQGKYNELAGTDTSFQQLINEQSDSTDDEEHPSQQSKNDPSMQGPIVSPVIAQKENVIPVKPNDEKAKVGTKLMQDEERSVGSVVSSAYYQYAVACGGVLMFTVLFIFFCGTVALGIVVNWWLFNQAELEARGEGYSLGVFLGVYYGMAFGYAFLTMVRGIWYLTLALYASKRLHNRMLQSVLHAPITFFDTTPIGRIISRFSRDVNVLDELLPQFFQQMLITCLNLVGTYIFIGVILPLFFAFATPITIGYFFLQRFFNRTSIELKRLDAISKSPIYAHFSETLGGLSTLRAYEKQEQSRHENMKMIDINQRAYFSWIAANRWFSLWLEIPGSSLIFAVAILGVAARASTFSGTIGLSLSFAIQVTSILGFSVRSITELEGQMSAVERANYYCKELPQEAPAVLDKANEASHPEGWPVEGKIEIVNAQMRYREELDLVLKGVDVSIEGSEKVGVVGRTGSGKSSLMIALLRMVELSAGEILIDGVNIRNLGLDKVRSQITIIPQDPVIFSGTIRFNLDPFDQHNDVELWDALEKSHLKEFVMDIEGGLDARVSEYGENMSAGQRQVICLTRALLRKSKILILDEASSSLDSETDRMIQDTIRTHLKDATILTIAHRLFTLADYDKILVMDNGLVAEYGSPQQLLDISDGKFKALVDSMGPSGAAQFTQLVFSSNHDHST